MRIYSWTMKLSRGVALGGDVHLHISGNHLEVRGIVVQHAKEVKHGILAIAGGLVTLWWG